MDYNLIECTEEELDKVRAVITTNIIMAAVPTANDLVNQLQYVTFQEKSSLSFHVNIILTGQAIIDALNS